MHDQCFMCGCVPLAEAIPATLATIAEDERRRMPRTEITVAEMNDDERAALFSWITSTLDRPPLERATTDGPYGSLVSFLEALRWDLSDRTIDPGSPVVGTMSVPFPHPRVVAALRGEVTTTDAGSSRSMVVDSMGFVQG